MSASSPTNPCGVAELFDAVTRLSPDEIDQFSLRFAEWQARRKLPVADVKRLAELTRKSEVENLSNEERDEYRKLSRNAERLDVVRVQALAELVHRQGEPVEKVMQEIGWESGNDGS